MKIDVAVMTRNSERFLDSCLSSIERNIDVNKLIVVDGNSEDDTLAIAEKHSALVLSDEGKGLGYARRLAIKNVETPWFAFVDSDVIIQENWLKNVLGFKLYNPGAIESLAINIAGEGEEAITQTHNRVMNRRYKGATEIKGLTGRGFTGATLLKHEAVSDAKMPNVPCCEDWIITQHIISKGYKWYKVPVEVLHHDRFSERPDRIRQTHAMGRILGYMSLPWIMRKTVTALIGRLLLSLLLLNPQYFLYRIEYTRSSFEGWFHPERYIHMKYPGWDSE